MIRLALIWHQHQPCYLDMRRGESAMPWVRLHGTKDYWGMPAILREFPGVKAHVNLVPGLLAQIDEAANGSGDPWLRLAKVPAEELRAEEKTAILETFFMANEEHMIRAHARYGDLLSKARGPGRWKPEALDASDWRDLQVWQNLAWFHPLLRLANPVVKALVEKGRDFTEEEKLALLEEQRKTLRNLAPEHKAMQDAGQIEIMTSAYWHPILPLLCRMESARVAMPDVALPRAAGLDMLDDARAQLARAKALYRTKFGRDVRGLWPSEGSVSPEILPLLEEQGIRWFATDEGILESSIGGDFRRDSRGVPARPDQLYRPWRVGSVSAVFRDRLLADLVGFEYKRSNPQEAAVDLVERIRACGHRADGDPLVTIALDGENAWEHYPGNGVEFLRHFYRLVQDAKDIRTVLLGDELAQNPPAHAIERLWSGSWIHRNFAIWIGHPEDNAGWDLLGPARARLIERTKQEGRDPRHEPPPPLVPPADRRGLAWAWEAMFAAEGSDWFWWYGDQHYTPLAGQFDDLFRSHLLNVYHFLGDTPPAALYRPIKGRAQQAPAWTPPWAVLDVKVDGRRSDYYEWLSAGHYASSRDLDVMDRSGAWIRDVWFGFDKKHLCVRVDAHGRADEGLATRSVSLVFAQPPGRTVVVRAGGKAEGLAARAAAGEILEIAVPLASLDVLSGETLEFFVEAAAGPAVQRVPTRMPISLQVPQDEEDRVNWMA